MDGSTAPTPDRAASDDLQIAYRPVAELIPYARNARTHSPAQVALIAGSIREYGFTNPVLVDGANGIIAGHGRVMAARKLGLATVPVIELAHLSEAQKRAYILADNRLAEQAGWDREFLALELGDLRDMAVDLASLGFDAGELDALLRSGEADPREDEVPEVPVVPVSSARRSVGAGPSQADLRRCHRSGGGGAGAGRGCATSDGLRSALWRGI